MVWSFNESYGLFLCRLRKTLRNNSFGQAAAVAIRRYSWKQSQRRYTKVTIKSTKFQLWYWPDVTNKSARWDNVHATTPHLQVKITITARTAYNLTTRDRNVFHCRQVPFNTGTWSLDPRECVYTHTHTHSAKHRFPLCPGSVEDRFN